MATVHFSGKWDMAWRKRFNVPAGFILFQVADASLFRLRKVMNRLAEKQAEKGKLYDLDVEVTIYYQRRTLDQNSLMWSLYTIEADIQNAGRPDQDPVTPDSLYDADMKKFAPARDIITRLQDLDDLPQFGVKVRNVVPLGDGMCKATVYKTSSDFDTVQMHRHLEFLFNRINAHGIPLEQSSDIETYWKEWRQEINDKGIELHEDLMTPTEYRLANPICEATGEYIGPTQADVAGRGEVHHIRSRGAGGDEPERDKPANWLHLSVRAHREWHDQGVETFLKKYPHLETKIRKALKEGNLGESHDHARDETGR